MHHTPQFPAAPNTPDRRCHSARTFPACRHVCCSCTAHGSNCCCCCKLDTDTSHLVVTFIVHCRPSPAEASHPPCAAEAIEREPGLPARHRPEGKLSSGGPAATAAVGEQEKRKRCYMDTHPCDQLAQEVVSICHHCGRLLLPGRLLAGMCLPCSGYGAWRVCKLEPRPTDCRKITKNAGGTTSAGEELTYPIPCIIQIENTRVGGSE